MPKRRKNRPDRAAPLQLPLFAAAASLVRTRPDRNEWRSSSPKRTASRSLGLHVGAADLHNRYKITRIRAPSRARVTLRDFP